MAVSFSSDGAVGYITLDKPPANSYDSTSWRRWARRSTPPRPTTRSRS